MRFLKKRCSAFVIAVLMVVFSAITAITVLGSEVNTAVDIYGIEYALNGDGSGAVVVNGHNAVGSVTVSESVEIGGKTYSVTEISAKAFKGSVIESAELPASIVKIGDEAFAECYNLSSVEFNLGTVSIGNKVFSGCSELASFSGADNVIYVGAGALDGTIWYRNSSRSNVPVYLGKSLYRYLGVDSPSVFSIKSGTVSISPYAFENRKYLLNVNIDNVVIIGTGAFRGCTSLTSLPINDKIEYIGDSAFDGCSNISGDIVFPETVKYIGGYAFRGCGITSADLSSTGINCVSNCLFNSCGALEAVYLPESAVSIGYAAFSNCTSLSSVSAPLVKSVDYNAFRGCSALYDKSSFESVEFVGTGAFDGTGIYSEAGGKALTVGSALYKTEESEISKFIVENGIKQVSPYALYNADSLELLVLPETLDRIYADSIPSNESTEIYVFATADEVYEDLSGLSAGTVYIPQGKQVENENIKVGYITGISVSKMPDKVEYDSDEQFDPSGMVIELNTVLDDTQKSINIADLGYAPEYEYNFVSSLIVKVKYCGYTVEIEMMVSRDTVPGDLNSDGKVNTDDIVLMRAYLGGLINDEAINTEAADIDGTPGISTNDLVMLRKIIAGLLVISE